MCNELALALLRIEISFFFLPSSPLRQNLDKKNQFFPYSNNFMLSADFQNVKNYQDFENIQ